MISVVIDTNVFVAGLRSDGGASRAVLRDALQGKIEPLFGNALWLEYEDLLGRPVWSDATTRQERLQVLAALARMGRWVTIYYGKKRGQTRFIQMQMGTGVVLLPWSARGKYGVRLDLTITADIGPDVPLPANASAP